MQQRADIGLIGLAVMGQNLVLNMVDHGFRVAVFNRTRATTEAFVAAAGRAEIVDTATLEELVAAIARPRRVMLMVQAGRATDAVLDALVPLLEPGDVVIDGGNSHFHDTERRGAALGAHGLHFVGTGVSGGEEGARFGPSIMPGGPIEAWERVKDVLQAISAKVDGDPCCEWMGEGGAGHFVKMVHNGIEYGDMQLIAEAYHLMRDALGMDAPAMHEAFARWNEGPLDSYLVEITRDILATYDDEGRLVLDLILDRAGQKGTGRWTVTSALETGQPVTMMAEAVFARSLSSMKEERERAALVLQAPAAPAALDRAGLLADLEGAMYASKIVSYAQGYMLLRAMARERGWSTDLGATARVWRGGCIVRSRFLGDITDAFEADPELENLMQVPFFAAALRSADSAWRRVVAAAVASGIPTPVMSSALSFFDGYRSARLPANLLQAQRDYFGAHTYERVDRPRGEFFHTDWTGSGGSVTARSYEA
jgi:6-phosphogluconate dehydrogenase